MISNPYIDEHYNNFFIRTFSENIDSDDLIWHRDRNDRLITILKSNNWKLQFDNQLPILLIENYSYFIPKEHFHRIIKGTNDLMIKIVEY